jgi:hypothetical protein
MGQSERAITSPMLRQCSAPMPRYRSRSGRRTSRASLSASACGVRSGAGLWKRPPSSNAGSRNDPDDAGAAPPPSLLRKAGKHALARQHETLACAIERRDASQAIASRAARQLVQRCTRSRCSPWKSVRMTSRCSANDDPSLKKLPSENAAAFPSPMW